MVDCSHPKYGDQHCAEQACANYYNKCPRHANGGREGLSCSRDDIPENERRAQWGDR